MNDQPLKILFVATGPESQRLMPLIDGKGLEGLKKNLNKRGCPDEVFEYALQNNIIRNKNGEYPKFQCNQLPEKYWKYLLWDIGKYDFDMYRDEIVNILTRYFCPLSKTIYYTTVDWQILSPSYCNTLEKVHQNDQDYFDKKGINFGFQEHHTCTFQDFIKEKVARKEQEGHLDNYDIVWFLGCCTPSYFVDMEPSYINNFQKILKQDGFIIHMDPIPGGNGKLGLLDMEVRQQTVKPKEIKTIKYLTQYLKQIQTGIYQFNIN